MNALLLSVVGIQCARQGSDVVVNGRPVSASALRAVSVLDPSGSRRIMGDLVGTDKAVIVYLRHLGWPYCWSFANDMAKQRPRLAAAGIAGPVMVSLGDEMKLSAFLDLNPGIPRELLFADSSETADAYSAANFGVIGSMPPSPSGMKPPDVDWFKYLANVAEVMPTIKKWNEVPPAVIQLGGTFVLDGEQATYGWADSIPGDYPAVEEVMRAAGL